MAAIEIIAARYRDIDAIGRDMRQADVDEVDASLGVDPFEALARSYFGSKECWVASVDGEPLCMWGVSEVCDLGLRVGCVWMLTTNAVDRHKREFVQACIEVLPALFERWDVLVNAIDARHEKAIRWGRRLGFVFQPPRPWGPKGLDFCMFKVTKEDVACALSTMS